MSVTSYAQNFEDVILWRALKHVERGFYIDLGAQDPIVDSVSLAFYEQGWRGVHVEPTAHYAEKLRSARLDEEVIEAAVGAGQGRITFYEIADTGLSTGNRVIAERHKTGGRDVRRVKVRSLPLSEILDRYRDRDIHWLKIDVEGMEKQVIESWSPSPARPWIVVVESTKPLTSEPNFADWDPSLVELGYDFVYFDGLNRFYVSRKHPELKIHFGPGPNVFDGMVLSGLSSATFCHNINAKAADLDQQLAERSAEIVQFRDEHAARETRLDQQLAERSAEIARLRDEHAERETKLDQQLAERSAEIVGLRDEHAARAAKLDQQLAERSAEIVGLRDEHAARETKLDQQLAGRSAEIVGLRDEHAAREAGLDQQLAERGAEIARLRDDHAARETRLDQQLAERADEVAKLAQTVQDLRARIDVQAETFAKAAAAWEKASGALKAELVAKRDAISARDTELDRLQDVIAEKDARLQAAKAQLAERADEVAKHAETVQDLRAQSDVQAETYAKAENALQERLSMLELQIESLHRSTSWRVTAPLRFVRRWPNLLVVGSWAWLTLRPGSRPRRVARRLVVRLAGRLPPHRRLTPLAKHMLSSLPALEARLHGLVAGHPAPVPAKIMTQTERRIYNSIVFYKKDSER